ncbi:MAG: 30S ribosome-binding factor RbfA [Dehalococcoidia bacterium]
MRHPGQQLRLVRRGRRDSDVPHGAGPLSRRTEKVGDLIQTVLADIVRLRVKDPGLTDAIFSFASVEVSPDLAHAKVRVSVLTTDEDGAEAAKASVLAALTRSEPYLQREMGKELHMRRIPRLQFVLDESMEEGSRMMALLRDVARSEGREF